LHALNTFLITRRVAAEWLGTESGERNVKVELVVARKKIMVMKPGTVRDNLRMIDLRFKERITFFLGNDRMLNVMSLKLAGETDFVSKGKKIVLSYSYIKPNLHYASIYLPH
jgi:hypothetical protein